MGKYSTVKAKIKGLGFPFWIGFTITIASFGAGISWTFFETFRYNPLKDKYESLKSNQNSSIDISEINCGNWEWQWAGQNWKGIIHFEKEGENLFRTDLDIKKECVLKNKNDDQYFKLSHIPVLKAFEKGTARIISNSLVLKGLKVNKYLFDTICLDNNKKIEGIKIIDSTKVTIESYDIKLVPAFAGRIYYKQNNDKYQIGDIIIVGYTSAVQDK